MKEFELKRSMSQSAKALSLQRLRTRKHGNYFLNFLWQDRLGVETVHARAEGHLLGRRVRVS